MTANALVPTDEAQAAFNAFAGVLGVLEGAADTLPPKDAQALRTLVSTARDCLCDLAAHDAHQTRIALAAMQVALKVQAQRDAHRARYAELVEALEANDTDHPLVEMFVTTYGSDTGNLLDDLAQALGDPDAAAIIADLAQGYASPEGLDYLIEQLGLLRQGLPEGEGN